MVFLYPSMSFFTISDTSEHALLHSLKTAFIFATVPNKQDHETQKIMTELLRNQILKNTRAHIQLGVMLILLYRPATVGITTDKQFYSLVVNV